MSRDSQYSADAKREPKHDRIEHESDSNFRTKGDQEKNSEIHWLYFIHEYRNSLSAAAKQFITGKYCRVFVDLLGKWAEPKSSL
jgi:hypothetical protein